VRTLLLLLLAGCVPTPPEPAITWTDWHHVWAQRSLGSSAYHVDLLSGTTDVELDFGARLGGAALEVAGERGGGTYTLRRRFRTHEDKLRLQPEPGSDGLLVTVHHHLRAAPAVSARLGRRE